MSYVGVGLVGLGQGQGAVPKAKVVDAVGTLSYGEEGFAVVAFDPYGQQVLVAPLHGAGVEGGVVADALHQMRIALGVQVVAPVQRNVVALLRD